MRRAWSKACVPELWRAEGEGVVRTERDILGFITYRIDEHERYLKMNQEQIGRAIVNDDDYPETLIQTCREIKYVVKELRHIANCEWPADFVASAPLEEVAS